MQLTAAKLDAQLSLHMQQELGAVFRARAQAV